MTLTLEVSFVKVFTFTFLPAILLDPQPLCQTETPLSVAIQSGLPLEGIRVLIQGGAHLDFRSRDGLTPVHKAVRAHNHAGLLVRVLS